MTEDELYLYKENAQRCCTKHYRDRIQQAMLIRSAKTPEDKQLIVRAIMDARLRWLDWLTIQQRKWQANTSRRPQRGRHHDSWAIREKYVRCTP